jgi:hypothetical protein
LDCAEYKTHVLPLQQPPPHEFASQTHCPVLLLHSRFAPQGPHVAPAVPHDAVDSCAKSSHVPAGPPLQHPLGHVLESHVQVPAVVPVLVSHTPLAQGPHAAPPVPHSELVWEP